MKGKVIMSTERVEELRECPLCGKEAHLQFNGATTFHHDVCVMCSPCGLTTKWFKGMDKVQEAIKLWNTRKPEGDLRGAVKHLLNAVKYTEPPKNFGTEQEPNLCYEARIPIAFVKDVEQALGGRKELSK